jgi:hypothetical protein
VADQPHHDAVIASEVLDVHGRASWRESRDWSRLAAGRCQAQQRDLTRGHLGSGSSATFAGISSVPSCATDRPSVRLPHRSSRPAWLSARQSVARTALTRTPAGAVAAAAPTRWWSWLDGRAPDVPYPSVRSGQPRSTAVGAHACRAVGSSHPERSEGASQARGASGRGSTLPCPADRSLVAGGPGTPYGVRDQTGPEAPMLTRFLTGRAATPGMNEYRMG